MLSNCQSYALAAVRHSENATMSVGRVNAPHCVVGVQHQPLGIAPAAFMGSPDDLATADMPSGKPLEAGTGSRGLSADLRRLKRGLPRQTATHSANHAPAAVWAALVLSRTMCS